MWKMDLNIIFFALHFANSVIVLWNEMKRNEKKT